MPTLPITANYRRDGDDWAVTVRTADRALDVTAPGLIAARVQVDQLVDQLVDEVSGGSADRAVVHMLDGDAYAFTVVYLHTRHGLPLPRDASPPHEQAIEA